MRTIKNILAAAALLLSAAPICLADDNVNRYGADPKISDLALIYAGNTHRPDWTKVQLEPYVTHVYADGSEDWLFDGFLFLEFSKGDIAYQNGLKLEPANQEEWKELLDMYFAPGLKLHALDELISDKKAVLGQPPLRHKVVITCIAPTKLPKGTWSRDSWGKVNNKSLRFISKSDRVKAVQWYIDTLLEMWEQAGFENLDLEGVYWVEEGLYTNGEIIPEINEYIHSKGLKSYWIPYYRDNQAYWSKWADPYGFDMVYLQPNYAFYNSATGQVFPYSLLTETIDTAKAYGMGLELEFETQGASNALHSANPELHQHINDYMDEFEKRGVFDEAGVAYYSGTQGMIHMANSRDSVDHATIDRLARYVAKRQQKRAQNASVSEVIADSDSLATVTDRNVSLADGVACHDINGRLIHAGGGTFECPAGIYIVSDKGGRSMKLFVK